MASPSRNILKEELHPLLAHSLRLGPWKVVRTCLLSDRYVSEQEGGFRNLLVCLPCFLGMETEAQERGDPFSEWRVQTRTQFFSKFLLSFTTKSFSFHVLIINSSLLLFPTRAEIITSSFGGQYLLTDYWLELTWLFCSSIFIHFFQIFIVLKQAK